MKIRIKKKTLILLIALTVLLPMVFAADVSRSFFVLLNLGNNGPTIVDVTAPGATDPNENGTKAIYFLFNASDEDGYDNLDHATAQVLVTLSGGDTHTSSGCVPFVNSSNFTSYNCTVTFNYYDNASSSWLINASVQDINANSTFNDTEAFTLNSISSMHLLSYSLNFGSVSLGSTAAAQDNPFILNNTGNFDFTEVNVTGYDLSGITTPSEVIFAANFTASITDAEGTELVNGTTIQVPSASLAHGAPGAGAISNESLYFYVRVADSGLGSQNYNATDMWTITVS